MINPNALPHGNPEPELPVPHRLGAVEVTNGDDTLLLSGLQAAAESLLSFRDWKNGTGGWEDFRNQGQAFHGSEAAKPEAVDDASHQRQEVLGPRAGQMAVGPTVEHVGQFGLPIQAEKQIPLGVSKQDHPRKVA